MPIAAAAFAFCYELEPLISNKEPLLPNESLSSSNLLTTNTGHNCSSVRLLIVVEGTTDIALLTRISALLAATEPSVPNLAALESQGKIVFVPFGGGNVAAWHDRLRPLEILEFHVYDGELPPETAVRQRAAELVNARPNCRAFVTHKRSLENYLHPQAIVAAGGPAVAFGDADNVAEIVVQARHKASFRFPWAALPRSRRRKLLHKTKRWLCTDVARHMTPALLAESDPAGEIRSWLAAIAELLA